MAAMTLAKVDISMRVIVRQRRKSKGTHPWAGLSLIPYFIAQIEDDLRVLTCQGLIYRFHLFAEERMRIGAERALASVHVLVPTILS